MQKLFSKFLPGGGKGWKGLFAILIILFGLWSLSGIYRVNPQEQGVVLRFGEFVRTTQPGLHYHLPSPIEKVITPDVTRENKIEIGYRGFGGGTANRRDVPDESKMITGAEIILILILWFFGRYLMLVNTYLIYRILLKPLKLRLSR